MFVISNIAVIYASWSQLAKKSINTSTNLFSAIKQNNYNIITKQQKATREAIRHNELVAYSISKSYKPGGEVWGCGALLPTGLCSSTEFFFEFSSKK